VLAFNAALIALVVTDNPYTHGFVTSFHLERQMLLSNWWGVSIFVLFIAAFTASTLAAFRVLMMGARKTNCEHGRAFSFLNIAEMSREEYRAMMNNVDDARVIHALQDHAYLAAVLARRKARWLKVAWVFLGVAIFSAVAFVIFTVLLAQDPSVTLH